MKKEKLTIKAEDYNQLHNILRLLDVSPNFPFAANETVRDYYLSTWYTYELPHELPSDLRLRILGN